MKKSYKYFPEGSTQYENILSSAQVEDVTVVYPTWGNNNSGYNIFPLRGRNGRRIGDLLLHLWETDANNFAWTQEESMRSKTLGVTREIRIKI